MIRILKLKRMNWTKKIFLFFFLLTILLSASRVEAATLAERLSGKIVLQVEAQGQAYYINPLDLKKYYLGRPSDAFELMRSLGLGVSDYDLNKFLTNKAKSNLAGRILLQVESKGQAYYVNPTDMKLYYLGCPSDAFQLMRKLGLGITDSDLSKISSGIVGSSNGSVSVDGKKTIKFVWKYNNKDYYLYQTFYDSWYENYENSKKYLSYSSDNPPADIREKYYDIFLTQKQGDDSIEKLVDGLKRVAKIDNLSEDEFLEFAMAFVQYIPYDYSKNKNSSQNFPYETLYSDSGICSDKAFLALSMLRVIGYGGAIFDFPDVNHSAVAVSCSSQSSYNSGYCFIETTNYFPVGTFPGNLESGQANTTIDWDNILGQNSWGDLEIYQKTSGKIYNGMLDTVTMINTMKNLQKNIQEEKTELDFKSNQIEILSSDLKSLLNTVDEYKKTGDTYNYNLTVAEYNNKVKEYNDFVSVYYSEVDVYNNNVANFNEAVNNFWQIS